LLEEEYALKLINPRYSIDPVAVRRFLHEALLTRQIDQVHVVRVYDADETDDGQPYVVMEYVPGTTLRQILRSSDTDGQHPMDPLRAINIASQVCDALTAAHQKRIIHRDIKPDNILVVSGNDNDLVKVVDFGLAKTELQTSSTQTQLSHTGVFVGTPVYCSPEQAMAGTGQSVDYRSDIYSLGVVLYEMLVGQPPFTGDNHDQLLQQHRFTRPLLPCEVRPELHIPEQIVNLTMQALNKDPEDRFSSADEMRRALQDTRDVILRPRNLQPLPKTTLDGASPPLGPDRREPQPNGVDQPGHPVTPSSSKSRFLALVIVLLMVGAGLFGYLRFVQLRTAREKISLAQHEIRDKIAKAKQLREQGNYEQAIALYQEIEAVDPTNAEAADGMKATDFAKMISEAELSINRAEYDVAIRKLQDVLQRDPQNVRARSDLDNALEKKVFGK
jgi:serine/threonine protein kinase